jgi:peptidoglycan hydrolase-like protein with peptidoglycan-binding domain
METKTKLTLGSIGIVALLIAGISYWAIREYSQSAPPEVPSQSFQTQPAAENSPDASPQTSPPSIAPAMLNPAPLQPTAASQSKEVNGPPSVPSTSAALEQSRQTVSEKPTSASGALAMPDEDKMSEANRRQVQEALHGLGYYNGPVDGIFGPLTRASIQRFQDTIGEKTTGLLTAAEADRLVGSTGLGTSTGVPGTEGLVGIPDAPVGHRQPTQADLPPSVRQEEQGNVPTPDNPTKAQTNTRARSGSKRESADTPSTGTYGQIPSICTGC